MFASLFVLAVVFLVAILSWSWFRQKTNSIVSDLQGQITLLKLRLQDMEKELNSLRDELKQKHNTQK